MEKVWPPPKDRVYQPLIEAQFDAELPAQHTQDQLVDSYFRHVHPAFPVLHKEGFLAEYHARYA